MIFLYLLDQTRKTFEPSEQSDLEKITETAMSCVDKFAPEKISTVKRLTNDWITNNLKNEITKKNKLCQKRINYPTEENKTNYRKQMNMVTTMMKNAPKYC